MRTDSGAREERQLLCSLVEQMPAIAWTTDRELRFTSSVGGGLAGLGLSPGEVAGRTLHDYLGTSDPKMAAIAAHEAALEGRSTRYEQNWQGRRYASHVVPLRDDEGTVVGAAGVSLDVTERMWEPGALFEAETKYQGLVETIPAVPYIDPLDEWSDSIYVSPQVTELLGYTPEEWLTDSGFWRDRVHPDDVDRGVGRMGPGTRLRLAAPERVPDGPSGRSRRVGERARRHPEGRRRPAVGRAGRDGGHHRAQAGRGRARAGLAAGTRGCRAPSGAGRHEEPSSPRRGPRSPRPHRHGARFGDGSGELAYRRGRGQARPDPGGRGGRSQAQPAGERPARPGASGARVGRAGPPPHGCW